MWLVTNKPEYGRLLLTVTNELTRKGVIMTKAWQQAMLENERVNRLIESPGDYTARDLLELMVRNLITYEHGYLKPHWAYRDNGSIMDEQWWMDASEHTHEQCHLREEQDNYPAERHPSF